MGPAALAVRVVSTFQHLLAPSDACATSCTSCRYRQALEAHPSGPPEIRLGIAACFFKAGASDKAQMTYERVLELDPDNSDALLGLATVKLASSNVQQVKEAVLSRIIGAGH